MESPCQRNVELCGQSGEDIDDDQQADLNAPAHGKAVNVDTPVRVARV